MNKSEGRPGLGVDQDQPYRKHLKLKAPYRLAFYCREIWNFGL